MVNTYSIVGEILDGKKPMPEINVGIETVSIVKAAGVLLAAGVLFLLIKKLVD